jgi:ABC-type antimicrobial peptide transport system permease subunit
VLQDLDPDLPLFAIATLDDTLRSEAWPLRLFGSMFGVFALAALILASVGLYAVIACSVAQRTRDIGVCLALGAQARHVCWTVSGHVTIHVAIGVAVGFAGAVAFGQVLQSILAGIRGGDPATLLSVPAVLLLAAVAACVGPLRRAMHIDPIVALRAE